MQKTYKSRAIDSIAQNTISQYKPELVTGEPCEIPIEEIVELHFGLILQYRNLSKAGNIHGITVFENSYIPIYDDEHKRYEPIIVKAGTILIDKRLLASNRVKRLRFTLAHELAHHIIHREYYKKTNELASKLSSDSDMQTEKEADELGAALLMPYGRIKVAYKRLGEKLNKKALIHHLSLMFNVSTQAMEIRLGRIGLL